MKHLTVFIVSMLDLPCPLAQTGTGIDTRPDVGMGSIRDNQGPLCPRSLLGNGRDRQSWRVR